MMNPITSSKAARKMLVLLMAVLGAGALFGGAVLIISPSGALLGMPLSMLDSSPFHSFLIPGLLLFSVLGVLPAILVFALLKQPDWPIAERMNFFSDMHWSWSFSIYTAFALIIWLQSEMMFLNAVNWLHSVYMFWAVAIIFSALLPAVRKLYAKAEISSILKNKHAITTISVIRKGKPKRKGYDS